MAKVILCIHGRSPKPSRDVLLDWCRRSIEEGLQKNQRSSLADIKVDLAYYADIYYTPLAEAADPEPYKPAAEGALRRHKGAVLDKIRGWAGTWSDSPLDWLEEKSSVFSGLARVVAKKTLKDLGAYYKDEEIRAQIHKRLLDKILEYQHDQIVLISHSMGAIVAYEVLTELGQNPVRPAIRIPWFVTLGAPLGLTPVKGEIAKGGVQALITPAVVTQSWYNFADPQDFVCLDNHLADDYVANQLGIEVKDTIISNDYPDNPHKIYGYLRTPEFSDFLVSG